MPDSDTSRTMPETEATRENTYLTGGLPRLFARTALPIILVMAMNGLFTLVDAYFLGQYAGADALTAVTLMFPLYMLMIALMTLVSTGFSSIYARLLGAGDLRSAADVFAQAMTLSVVVCIAMMVAFALGGDTLALQIANGDQNLADLGHLYMLILIAFSPISFILSANSDAFRCEGLVSVMAGISIGAALLNILFDYILIVPLQMGVAGSAYGTVLANFCVLAVVVVVRLRHPGDIFRWGRLFSLKLQYWRSLLALGAPSTFNYVGISLTASLTLYCLQVWASDHYAVIAGAYGVITRLLTFTYLPLIGLGIAYQTILGNNFGAGLRTRADQATAIALGTAFVYSVVVQVLFLLFRSDIGFIFVQDQAMVDEIARILPLVTLLLFMAGPGIMIGMLFQAIGDARRAAVLTLSRTYLFGLPLIFSIPFLFGETGIWYGGILAEILATLLAVLVLWHRARRHNARWGLAV